jgi:WD40 repeat protein
MHLFYHNVIVILTKNTLLTSENQGLNCAKQLAQLNPKQIVCPVCRSTTKIKTKVDKDLTANFALIPIIDAHLHAVATAKPSSSTATTSLPPPNVNQLHPVAVPLPGRPIISTDQLTERMHQISEIQNYLMTAISNLPISIGLQQSQIVSQFNILRQAVEEAQVSMLQNLVTLQATVHTQFHQELNNCSQHITEIHKLIDAYPSSILDKDINQWIEAEDIWRSKVSVMQQHGLLGAFTANVPMSIPDASISYEGHSIDFSALWAISNDSKFFEQKMKSKPVKPIHFITHSASGVLRRWNYRDRITITEINHPGLRYWSVFDKGSKIVAASNKIKVFDSFSGECLATFDSLSSPAKKIIASGSDLKARAISFHVNQGAAALWDLSQNIRLNWNLDISGWNSNLVIPVAPDSNILLIPMISFPFDIMFFNMVTGDIEENKKLEGFLTDVVDVVPFGNGAFCVALCTGGSLTIWDLTSCKLLKSAIVDPKHFRISILKSRKKDIVQKILPVVACFSNLAGSFSIYDPMAERTLIITHNNSSMLSSSIRSVAIFDNGKKAISGHSNGKIHIWNLENGQCIETLVFGVTGHFIVCNQGHNIVIGTPNGYINIIDTGNLSVLPILPSVIDGSGIQVHLVGTTMRI